MASHAAPSATAAAATGPLTLTIRCTNDHRFPLVISDAAPASVTVGEVKRRIAQHEKAPANAQPENQRLIFAGRVLKDADTLDAAKLTKDCTIHLVVARAAAPAAPAATPAAAPTAAHAAPTAPVAGQQQPHLPPLSAFAPMGLGREGRAEPEYSHLRQGEPVRAAWPA